MRYIIGFVIFTFCAVLPTVALKILFTILWDENDFLGFGDLFTSEARTTTATLVGSFIGYCSYREGIEDALEKSEPMINESSSP